MEFKHLRKFDSLNSDSFAVLMRHLGFRRASVYRIDERVDPRTGRQEMSEVCSSESGFPVTATISNHYSSSSPLLGWVRRKELPFDVELWESGTNFYFPEQKYQEVKIVIAATPDPGKRCRPGRLDGNLEAVANRIRGFLAIQGERQAIDDSIVGQSEALYADFLASLDHELRTPLAAVAGYATLMSDLDPVTQGAELKECISVVERHAHATMGAVDKLSMSLKSAQLRERKIEVFDPQDVVKSLCEDLSRLISSESSPSREKKVNVFFAPTLDRRCNIEADLELFRSAVWEVLKNALHHSRNGRIDVRLYRSERKLILEIEDDGQGVSQGSEDLIFLRFYQEPRRGSRRTNRGLGLGLFLARTVAVRHMGELKLVQRSERGAIFRFVWPLHRGQSEAV